MKFKTVTYQKAFVIGPYLQERIGFEIELVKGDTVKSALNKAKEEAEDWHKESNNSIYAEAPVTANHLPEINIAERKEFENLEKLYDDKKHLLQDHEIFFAERVILTKEKTSYSKLIKLLEFK